MILAITIFLAFLFYKETLLYYFISDDFISVLSQKNYLNPLKISPFNNHYTPVNDIIDLFLFKTFGTNPFPFHLFAILVHLLNIYLVYKLTKLLIEAKTAVSLRKSADTFSSPAKREEKYGIKLFPAISALLFTFFFSNYEVVYWFGATNN